MLAVKRMEMRGSVLPPEHLDQDPEELADREHVGRLQADGYLRPKCAIWFPARVR